MTDRDSDAWREAETTRTARLWARGLQTMFAGGPELARLNGETMRLTLAPYTSSGQRDRGVAEIAPRRAATPETTRTPTQTPPATDDPFDEFLAGFEPELPLTH
ncbi:hypothetical protein ACFPYI_17920 [Halomarina salina]|uniref:Uncharacterized protein n=1 Tax=Halomarina salina TaxID=1872699 RepID=A0ABD5RSB6_9EURY|nr:hypothetical protein [Halomarina salina]